MSGLSWLYAVPDGIIAGSDEGELHWMAAGTIATYSYSGEARVIRLLPTSRYLTVPVLPSTYNSHLFTSSGSLEALCAEQSSFRAEKIELQMMECGGYRVWVGFGPVTKTWAVGAWEPARSLAREGAKT